MALSAGTILAVAVFAVAFILGLIGQPTTADAVTKLAIMFLLATPAGALVTTALELRATQRTAAFLAVAILGILAAATALALVPRQ